MCTVTFIPAKDKFYLTSNRDEKLMRKQALPPTRYVHNNATLVYPKDAEAGGTWVAMHQNGNAAVLLNGAFVRHISMPPYDKSRGIIFLEIMSANMPVRKFLKTTLNNIEPFTLIVFDDNNLYECRWDGNKKHCIQLNRNRHYIWSSSTLYNEDIVKKRELWFAKWLNKNPNPTQRDILQFHQFAGDGDAQNDLRMNRDDKMLTVSVTGIELTNDKGIMQYIDLKDNNVHGHLLEFISSYQVA